MKAEIIAPTPSENLPRPHGTKTLRDEFALAALSGLLSNEFLARMARLEKGWVSVAEMAYTVADSMLAHRAKRN